MTYRDIRYFRTQFKNRRKAFANEYVNEHFIGVQHGDFSGFFQLFHGTKDEIGDFLRGSFDMAEDSQAIYEFIQNAADCNSTQFCLFFDDENFLAVNNGSVFANGGVESILNIGQSYGKKTGDTIGRFGVGFKLVHRLVGVSDGLHEIVDLGAGPMLYSWSNISEIQSFLNTNLTLGSPSQEHEKAPWLLKILLTCFPAQPGEVVKNLQYVDHIPFKEQELDECRKYTCAKFASLDLSDFKQGSLFYLKLGSGKANLLRSEVKELERGASVSLRFLKDLKCIRLNDITLKSTLNWLKPGRIEPDTDEFRQIEIRDEKSRDYPLLIEVGYKTVEETADSLSSTPNFFKYFPIGDEVNRLQFIVHTNAFLIGTNRRHLHNDPINHRILQAVANHITQCMDDYQRINPKVYRDFFAAILLSQPPTETRNDWQYPHLYKPLLEYSRKYVPTDLGNYLPANSVIIKKTGLNLNPSEWGIDKDWFYWLKSDSAEYVKPLIRQADDKEKLDLKTWDLADLLRNGQFEKIKDWSKQQNWEDSQLVEPFFKEISEISEPEWKRDNNLIVTRFWDLPFLKLQGEESLFSIREILTKENVLIAQGRVSALREVEKLGLRVLRVPIQGGDIEQIIQQNIPYLKDQSLLFDKISNHLTAYIQEGKLPLKSEEKQNIFKCLQEISPIESGKLRKIPLFCDTTGTHRSMYQLLPIGFDSKSLLDQYKIHPNESKLDIAWSKFLSQDSEVYHQIIIPNWETILGSVTTENYSEWLGLVKKYYEMSNNKVALTGKKCILFKNKENDTSWVLPGEYFFHSKTSALEAEVYALASAAFSTIFGYPLLKPDWVKILSEPPFAVSNMHLGDIEISGQPDLIESRELNAFIFFWTTIGNDFFEHFLTNKAGNGLIQVLGRDDKQFQFYDQEGDIAKLVEEYLPNVGFRLPVELWEWATKSNNILRAGELQKELLDRLKIQLYEVGPKIAALLTTKENVQLLFNRTIEFILPERSEYREGDEELVWLSQAVNWLGNDDLAKLRRKIAIRPISGEMYNLEKAPANDFIKIDDYRFQKSRLFPNNAESKKASISQRILRSLERSNLNIDKLRRLFASNEDNWEETELIEWAEDISQSQDGVVENDDQAAFFALLLNSGRLDTSDIKMVAQDDEQQPLNSLWVLTPYAFVEPIYIPNNKYIDLAKRLKLGVNNPSFEFGADGKIITGFYFINSESFNFFGLIETPSLEQSLAAIEYLFSLWKKEGSSTEFSKRISIEQWSKTIGFIPESSVYPRQFALNEEESIPEWLDTWAGIDLQRQQFLMALGVQSFQSPVVQLRCFLESSDQKYTENDLIRGFNPDIPSQLSLLKNTLFWVAGREYELVDHLNIIRLINNQIAEKESESEVPSLVLHQITTTGKRYKVINCFQEANHVIVQHEIQLEELRNYGVSEQTLLDFLSDRNYLIADYHMIPEAWRIRFEQMELSEPVPDIKELAAHSELWEQVDEWILYLFNGKVPDLIYLKGVEDAPIVKIQKRDFVSVDNALYLNKIPGKQKVLGDAVDALGLNFSAFKSLISNSSNSTSGLNGAIENNDIELRIRALLPDIYDPEDIIPTWSNIDQRTRKEINDEAKRMAATWLRGKGYQVPKVDPPLSDYYRLLNIRNPSGQAVQVHVRSTKGGYLYLSPQDWAELAEQNTILIVILPGNRITSVNFDDLIRRNDRVELQFNAQSFSPHELGLLAQLFAFRTDVKFVFKSPDFVATDYIQTFGLHERKKESISAVPTSVID